MERDQISRGKLTLMTFCLSKITACCEDNRHHDGQFSERFILSRRRDRRKRFLGCHRKKCFGEWDRFVLRSGAETGKLDVVNFGAALRPITDVLEGKGHRFAIVVPRRVAITAHLEWIDLSRRTKVAGVIEIQVAVTVIPHVVVKSKIRIAIPTDIGQLRQLIETGQGEARAGERVFELIERLTAV